MYHFAHNTDVIELNNRWKESVIDTCKGRMYNIQQGTSTSTRAKDPAAGNKKGKTINDAPSPI